MKPEYQEGPEAREKFDAGMAKLFKAPKTVTIPVKELPKPKRKTKKKASKD
jgi:hypothetical protein